MLDFIIDLLFNVSQKQVFNIVLVIVNRYIKFERYIPTCKDQKTKNMANILIKKVFIKYNKFVSFVNNCNLFFTLNF